MLLIIGLILSYLVGSIPTAYLFGRIIKGIDIRKHGSGNVGATNAFRVLGAPIGITVLLLDACKGVIGVVCIADILLKQGIGLNPVFLRILLGLSAVLGHSLTIFLKFKGGKGMATTLGVLIGLAIKFSALKVILISELLIWAVVFLFSRIVSLASIISAVFFPLLFIALKQPLPFVVMSLCLSAFIIYRHKANIARLLAGGEPRLNFNKSSKA